MLTFAKVTFCMNLIDVFSFIDLYDLVDYTVLLSIATCDKTWHLHESARQSGVIHLAITGKCRSLEITIHNSLKIIIVAINIESFCC